MGGNEHIAFHVAIMTASKSVKAPRARQVSGYVTNRFCPSGGTRRFKLLLKLGSGPLESGFGINEVDHLFVEWPGPVIGCWFEAFKLGQICAVGLPGHPCDESQNQGPISLPATFCGPAIGKRLSQGGLVRAFDLRNRRRVSVFEH